MNTFQPGPFLEKINVPADLREKFTLEDLPQVSEEVRQYIIDVISEIGNSHFGASLGVVEMTVALHYVFNTPYDQLVWDVGHQAYGHKILTGQKTFFTPTESKGAFRGSRNVPKANMILLGLVIVQLLFPLL